MKKHQKEELMATLLVCVLVLAVSALFGWYA